MGNCGYNRHGTFGNWICFNLHQENSGAVYYSHCRSGGAADKILAIDKHIHPLN